MHLRLVCFVLVLLFIVLCQGQGNATAPVCKTACEANLTVCNHIDYNLYIHNDWEVVASNESQARSWLNYAVLIGDGPCRDQFSRFVCGVLHPSCNMSETNNPTPILPCAELCLDLRDECRDYLSVAQSLIGRYLNCSDPTIYSNSTDPPNSCSLLNNLEPVCTTNQIIWPGACQEFNLSQTPQYGAICGPYLTKTIYVQADVPEAQSLIDQYVSVGTTVVKLLQPVTPIECYQGLLATLCPILFPPCMMVDVPGYDTQVAVGQEICNDFCQINWDLCEDYFALSNLTWIIDDCAHYRFPTTNPYPVNISGVIVNVPCRDYKFAEQPAAPLSISPQLPCPTETGRKKHPKSSDPPCGLKCPDASYTMDEWRTIIVLTQVGSAISLICMSFLIASYFLMFEKRQFPTSLHLNEFMATFLFSISFLIGGTHPEKNVWCHDEGTNASQSNNTACGVQGFFFIFFGLALTSWCAVIAFTMFYTLVVNTERNSLPILYRNRKYFYLFAWGVPLAFGIGALASNSIGYGPPLAWCFIHFEGFGFGSGGISRDYPLFYIPDGILMITILALFIMIIAVIVHYRRTRLIHAEHNAGVDIFLRTQIRVLIFVFVIAAIFFTIFEWRLAIEAKNNQENLTNVGLSWTYCKIKISLEIPEPGNCPGDVNPARIDYGHTVFESFLLSGVGMLIFIAFGSDKNIYIHWAKMCKLALQGDWTGLQNLINKGTIHTKLGTTESLQSKPGQKGSKEMSGSGKASSHSDGGSEGAKVGREESGRDDATNSTGELEMHS